MQYAITMQITSKSILDKGIRCTSTKDNPIISQKHEKSKEIEEIALKTFDKKPLWKFANKMNLRGTSGFIKIFVPGKKSPLEKGIPAGYYQLYEHSLYRLNSVLYEVDRFEKKQKMMTIMEERHF